MPAIDPVAESCAERDIPNDESRERKMSARVVNIGPPLTSDSDRTIGTRYRTRGEELHGEVPEDASNARRGRETSPWEGKPTVCIAFQSAAVCDWQQNFFDFPGVGMDSDEQ